MTISKDWEPVIKAVYKAKVIGATYEITCPKCGVKYVLPYHNINKGVDIQCMDCGKIYKQDENVSGILIEDSDE